MSKTKWTVLVLILTGTSLASAEDLPYKRMLQGDDAKKAATLEQRIDELVAAGKFEGAVTPAEVLLALRKRVQGEGHWQTADAVRQVEALRKGASLPAEKQTALAGANGMNEKGVGLYGRGMYTEADGLLRKALLVREELLGLNHPDTVRSYTHLALNLQARGRLREAEPLFRKVLTVSEKVLGPTHPDTAATYNNLALNLHEQGRDREAEPLFRSALAVCEQLLGPVHTDTAAICNNLALSLQALGKVREAELLYRKALAVYEEALGPKHLSTAGTYGTLAFNLLEQHRAREAEALFRKALAVHEEVLGPKHPHTARHWNALALTLDDQGQGREAEALFRKALAVYEEVLGPKHPDTAATYHNLAFNLQDQGQVRGAEPLFRKALAINEEALGAKHPDTARNCNSLAFNLQAQGRTREAEALFRKALAVREEVLGPGHPDTAQSWSNLAATLQHQGRTREAEPLHRKALAVFEEVLGPKDTETARTCNNLAGSLQNQGRTKEAEPLYRKALDINEAILGPKHPITARSYSNLADNLKAQGRLEEAEPLQRKALAIREEVLGPTHPDTAESCNNLALNLDAGGRFEEAELLSRKALTIREEVLGPNHPHTANSYNNLAYVLHALGRAKDAESLWEKGAQAKEAVRLRVASSALDRATAVHIDPHFGLAVCRARLGRPADAWAATEAGLARGLLDDLAARAALPPDPEALRRDHDRAARLDALDRLLLSLLTPEKLDKEGRRRRDELVKERAALEDDVARAGADRSRRAILPLDGVQQRLAPDDALVFWLDNAQLGDHWGCVVRRRGPPAWVRLKGSGTGGAWTKADDRLPRLLRDDIIHAEPDVGRRARRLATQRLDPLAPHLIATDDLPAARRLLVVPVGVLAGIPVEALTDRYLVSYVPSGSVFARQREKHRSLGLPTLLALGDPNFALPGDPMPPQPPDQGLYVALVLPGGSAARAGLRPGDVLLSYSGVQLTTRADLKLAEDGDPVPAKVWRDGKTEEHRLRPGKLGVVLSNDPPAVALRQQRERDLLLDTRDRSEYQPLPGTRLEVASVAALLPKDSTTLLLGSDASEQRLAELAASGKLKQVRLLHLATHGHVDPISAAHSSLALARDRLPGIEEQDRLRAAGKKPATGVLSVESIADDWDLDADLVVLSACETALGPEGRGEGLLGFSQVLLGRGARSLLLSLWKVDDTATALLMTRFYQNLLGKRDGLKTAMPKAEALQEAKRWLRTLPRSEVEKLAGRLADGVVRAGLGPKGPDAPKEGPKPALPAGDAPFAHPRYWAAFILIGDPD